MEEIQPGEISTLKEPEEFIEKLCISIKNQSIRRKKMNNIE